ncbi:MAG TPA: trypsin-like peptidase domain-containing protein [Vicinamibacteria bacterium]|nr:trypsin-like peptidase domain-containing protein [Vicinamibacteria bacterium]
MRARRAVLGLAGLLGLLAGVVAGIRLAPRLAPEARASSAPAAAAAAAFAATPQSVDFTAVARRATPAVVNISAVQVVRTRRSPWNDPFLGDLFPGLRMPREERKTSLGSGVVVDAAGTIVTNNHVIERAREVTITTSDRRRLGASLVGTDPVTDIAVLRVRGAGLPALGWGDSSRAAVGEYVIAIGNPFRFNQTVTMGIISAVGRSNVGIVDYEDFIQTDAAINPGNSGGALVNTRGELIGINTAIYSETGGYQGIGFAVPANLARQIVGQLLEKGRVVRGWVGINRITDVSPETAAEFGLREAEGVLVLEIWRNSPADRGGLEPGDVIVGVEGRPVVDAAQLRNELARATVGERLRLTVVRNGRQRELALDVEEATERG